MELEPIRKKIIDLFGEVCPTLPDPVYTDAEFTAKFKRPFRARKIKYLHAYEKKHKVLFCRACTESDNEKGIILAYQMWCEKTDNLLDNKSDDWVRLQCFNCDMEILTPYIKPPTTHQHMMDAVRYQQQQMFGKSAAYKQMRQDQLRAAYGGQSRAAAKAEYHQHVQNQMAAIGQAGLQSQIKPKLNQP